MKLYQSTAIVICVGTLYACSSSDSTNNAVMSDTQGEETAGENTMAEVTPPDTAVAFPELQGTWAYACQFFDPEEPDEGYELTTVTVTGNTLNAETTIYSDSNCITLLERGFSQSGSSGQFNGFIERPEGSANTSVGAVPFIDTTIEETLIDNEPLIPSIALFFPVETTYDIVYVDGDTLYFGLEVDGLDGETPQTRPQQLDFTDPLTRQ